MQLRESKQRGLERGGHTLLQEMCKCCGCGERRREIAAWERERVVSGAALPSCKLGESGDDDGGGGGGSGGGGIIEKCASIISFLHLADVF